MLFKSAKVALAIALLGTPALAISLETVGTVIGKAFDLYSLISAEKSKTAITARGVLASVDFSGGSSLGVCYHGGGGGGCTWLSTDPSLTGNGECWQSGKTAMKKKSMGSGFRNTVIEVHAEKHALCIDHLSFSYGSGDMHPYDEKIIVTGDMTYECGHHWAYNTHSTGNYQHKCMFIGNIGWLQFKNTYSFNVEKLRTFRQSMTSGVMHDASKGYDAMKDVCKGMSSWKRDSLPGTYNRCDLYDVLTPRNKVSNARYDGKIPKIKKVKVSMEQHKANLKSNPNYVGNPVIDGVVEVEVYDSE
ncbi:hypothetical protein BX616_004736 [Lobosporangium transversale]|uniref:Pectin lyase fold/virulence factor n=1 Tax=Lobosporangium transversale TaxID=64571 RepID=A0A1Y2H1I1_9FUNG|nr:hypothetical protein BCR41DRAFT_383551 [Lobosporangium transversale]KAF9916053.1 hypothetical protein BX616_004736 [Lobosporangium transversale]ORZ27861.1 hypothetical protein BCR41DRAFT_383551 [Lobosporangium transversale]|eukprot:XP_021885564.1 hypothetical protein BCR41DRAFT_383551 [Lobosporangium transversale]